MSKRSRKRREQLKRARGPEGAKPVWVTQLVRRVPRWKSTTIQGPWWFWVTGIAFAVALILVGRQIPAPLHMEAELRAAFIDQLSPAFPNEEFRSSLTADIDIFGLPLDVYEGEEVNVGLYRSLGEHPYSVLVIRSHSGTLELGGGPDQRTTALFTNEPYSGSRHVAEQLVDRVLIVRPLEGDTELTFGVAPDFFRRSMRGELPRTVVVIAGCSILERTDLAEALVSRGASVVISWDLSVALDHVDRGTQLLVHYLLREGMTVEEAVNITMAESGPDPEFGAVLKYYPDSAGPRTAAQLTRR